MQEEKMRVAGQALRDMRENMHMTLREVSADTHISHANINRLELGITADPPFETMCRLAQYYNKTPNEIAEIYGYWHPKSESRDPRVRRLAEFALELPPEGKQELLSSVEIIMKVIGEKYQR